MLARLVPWWVIPSGLEKGLQAALARLGFTQPQEGPANAPITRVQTALPHDSAA